MVLSRTAWTGILCSMPSDAWGVAKLVKAPDFDSGMRGFESYLPSQNTERVACRRTLFVLPARPCVPLLRVGWIGGL